MSGDFTITSQLNDQQRKRCLDWMTAELRREAKTDRYRQNQSQTDITLLAENCADHFKIYQDRETLYPPDDIFELAYEAEALWKQSTVH